jgi:hypothetical protein
VGAYPWELLYEEPRGFLFANPRAALVRYIDCSIPVPELVTSDAINLLLVTPRPISRPTDPIRLLPLVDSESKAITEGLATSSSGAIHLNPLPAASPNRSTWELLNDYLTTHTGAQAPHILHFDGHGGFGRRCAKAPAGCGLLTTVDDTVCRGCGRRLDGPAQGYLAFEARDKRPDWVSASEVSNLLVMSGVRLAVLTACKSAVVEGHSVFSGMGPALIQAGVPAVAAMQFSVTDEAASGFTRGFYLALAQHEPLTQAMGRARAMLFDNETAWYRPVLYLRTDAENPDGCLFTATEHRTRGKGQGDGQRRDRLPKTVAEQKGRLIEPGSVTGSEKQDYQDASVKWAKPQSQVPTTALVVPLTLLNLLDGHQKELGTAVNGYIWSKQQTIRCQKAVSHLETAEWDSKKLTETAFWITARENMRGVDLAAAIHPPEDCGSLLEEFQKAFDGASKRLKKAGTALPEPQLEKIRTEVRNCLESMWKQADAIAKECEDKAKGALALVESDITQIFKPTESAPAEPIIRQGASADKERQEEVEGRKVLRATGVRTPAPHTKSDRAR